MTSAATPPTKRTSRRLRLINPRSALSTITMPGIIQRMTFSRKCVFAPLNLMVCAAVVPDGWDVEIIDENTLAEPHLPSADGVDAVGLGAMTAQAPRAYEIADAYRALGVPVILGGIHASALPDEAAKHADVVCRGDAEGTLPPALRDLATRLDNGTPAEETKVYDWKDDPDRPIATPRKDLLNPKDYLVYNPIQTTRGCPHGCTFCTTPAIFGRRYRQRRIDDIVAEIVEAKETFGTKMFIFSDDNVAGSHRWAMDLFEALRPLEISWASQCDIRIAEDDNLLRAMRASGCAGLILGLESPSPKTLAEAGKTFVNADEYVRRIAKIQSHGISLWGSFIFGFDGDAWRSCRDTVRFARKARLLMSCYILLTPYPGTAVYEQFAAEGRLLTDDWTKYNGASVVFEPRPMSVDELRFAQLAAFRDFYAMPSALPRLGLWPFKKHGWLANLAIQRGYSYYFSKAGRPLPCFADYLEPDAADRIRRGLGERKQTGEKGITGFKGFGD